MWEGYFKKQQQIITSNVEFDYSNTDYQSVPNISVTVSNSIIIDLIILIVGITLSFVYSIDL